MRVVHKVKSVSGKVLHVTVPAGEKPDCHKDYGQVSPPMSPYYAHKAAANMDGNKPIVRENRW